MKYVILILIALAFFAAEPNASFAENTDKGVVAIQSGDFRTAFTELMPLAEQGDALAQYLVGVMYDMGNGTPMDPGTAVDWYKKAADQGMPDAQYTLGVIYSEGILVPEDNTTAVLWYRKAADQGLAAAQSNLGFMYLNGFGVRRNYTKAADWIRKAADQGDDLAQTMLGELYSSGDGVTLDRDQAMYWFQKAAAQGNPDAQKYLDNPIRIEMASTQAYARGRIIGTVVFSFFIQTGIGWVIRKLFKKRATFLAALWTVAIPMVFQVLAGLANIGKAIQSGEVVTIVNNPILVLAVFPFAVAVSFLFRTRQNGSNQHTE